MPRPQQSRSSTGAAFAKIEVRARDSAAAERVVAEAMEAGAAGLEEREGREGIRLLIYATAVGMEAVQRALLERCGGEVEVGAPETLREPRSRAKIHGPGARERGHTRSPYAATAGFFTRRNTNSPASKSTSIASSASKSLFNNSSASGF